WQAAQLALQHIVGTHGIIKLNERDVLNQAGQINTSLNTRVTATNDCDTLALEQGAITVGAVSHPFVAVLPFARRVDLAPTRARGQDNRAAFKRTTIGKLELSHAFARHKFSRFLDVHDVDIIIAHMLFKRCGKLWPSGFLDGNKV